MKVWPPTLRPVNVWVVGLVQRPAGAPSNAQRTVETASLTEKTNVPEVCVVVLAGSDDCVIPTEIGTGLRSIAETVPISDGPPGWKGYGG